MRVVCAMTMLPCALAYVQALPTMSPHHDFRLWLTTVPSEEFPGIILQVGLRIHPCMCARVCAHARVPACEWVRVC